MNDSHLCQNVGRFIQMHFKADIFPQNHNSLSQNNKNKLVWFIFATGPLAENV